MILYTPMLVLERAGTLRSRSNLLSYSSVVDGIKLNVSLDIRHIYKQVHTEVIEP